MTQILIVEDEMSIADTLVFALGGEGFATHWVRLGREAIEHVESGAPALVILAIIGFIGHSVQRTQRDATRRHALLGCVARTQTVYCLSNNLSTLHERIRFSGIAAI